MLDNKKLILLNILNYISNILLSILLIVVIYLIINEVSQYWKKCMYEGWIYNITNKACEK